MIRNFTQHILKTATIIILSLITMQVSYANNVVSDSVITSKIKAKQLQDKSISALNVNVETNNGIVRLDGTVDSDTQASAMVEMAQSTQGVRDVDTDDLTIKRSRAPISDTYITAKVKGIYLQQKLLHNTNIDPTSIHVETNNAVVYLSGEVATERTLRKVISLAKSVQGVKQVESRLKVVA